MQTPQNGSGSDPCRSGHWRPTAYEFRSRIFRNTRFLRLWLPPGYDDPGNEGRRYPVLYLNDGQNLFEPTTSFNGVEWQVDELADRLIREGAVPPMIIVGLDNAGKDRIREYMPHRSLQPMIVRVSGTRYPDFLTQDVMPFVARRYRVATGPENTGLGGSSLGGLISLYTAAVKPGLIGRLLIESPSLWASNRQMIRQSRSVRSWPDRVFLGTGTAEAGRPDRDPSMVTMSGSWQQSFVAAVWTTITSNSSSTKARTITSPTGPVASQMLFSFSLAIKDNESGVGADAFVRPSGKAAVRLQTENKPLSLDQVE